MRIMTQPNLIDIPDDINEVIFLNLDSLSDIAHLGCTSKALHRIFHSNSLWSSLLQKHFPRIAQETTTHCRERFAGLRSFARWTDDVHTNSFSFGSWICGIESYKDVMFIGGDDSTVRACNRAGKLLSAKKVSNDWIYDLSLATDASFISVISHDDCIFTLVDRSRLSMFYTMTQPGSGMCTAIHDNMILAGGKGYMHMYDQRDMKTQLMPANLSAYQNGRKCSLNGTYLAYTAFEQAFAFDLRNLSEPLVTGNADESPVSLYNSRFMYSPNDAAIVLYDLQTCETVPIDFQNPGVVYALAQDDNSVAMGDRDGQLSIYNVHTGKKVFSDRVHEDSIRDIARDSRGMVTGGDDTNIIVWEWPAISSFVSCGLFEEDT